MNTGKLIAYEKILNCSYFVFMDGELVATVYRNPDNRDKWTGHFVGCDKAAFYSEDRYATLAHMGVEEINDDPLN